ncbi:MAG TPA: diacylglycerol kinase family protein [Microlunatus sp.]|nr:diacylglycerol kinase family protein [Microlunatus sp.]
MDARAGRRCAVVFNPTKISDSFHQLMTDVLDREGWVDTLWLETSADDPGRAMTAEAVSAGVDLVIGAGGDGTIRIVADGLAGTGIAMGMIPAGTANLLARNLNVPLHEDAAVEVAVTGNSQTIDLIKITVDDREAEHFAVIAGIGVDAMIMDEVDDDLKAKVGSAAYFLAAGKALGRLPIDVTVHLDDRRPIRRRAMLCAIGNVSDLQGNITLIPGARPDDGLLDVYIASPRRLRHWLQLGVRLATRRPRKDDQVDQWTGKKVTVTIDGTDNYQLDGDVIGKCTRLVAEVVPAALAVQVPVADPATSMEPSSTPTPTRTGAAPATTRIAARRQRWSLRHGDYGFTPTTTVVDERPVRSLSAGRRLDLPEVVLLPGMGAPGYLAPLTRAISGWTQATVLDLPGWRAGRARGCPPTLTGVAVATARWLETTDREQVILFGHSTGAQSALGTALLMPERVAGVVIAGPTFDPPARKLPVLLERLPAALRREPFGEIGVVAPSYLASGGVHFVSFLRTALADRPEDIITKLAMPVLVLTGQHDGLAPPLWAQHLADLASASCIVLPGSHNAPYPYPAETDAALHQAVQAWSESTSTT